MHFLSSCKSKTPLQLYTEGMIHYNIIALDYFEPWWKIDKLLLKHVNTSCSSPYNELQF